MKNTKALKQFCNTLDGLQGLLLLFPKGVDEFLFTMGYPRHRKEVESLKEDLQELELYEVVRDAIAHSEALGLAGKYEEAADLVLEANRKLSTAFGAEDDLRRMYKSAND